MKREGRQHGVVTSHHIPPAALSRRRFIKMVDSSAVAGIFTRVPAKPTNHSKFTGKCRRPRCNGCHIHPACKSKDKAKGTMKLRSIDAGKELTKYFSGSSVTGVLAYLADESGYDDGHGYDDDEYDYEGMVEENYGYGYGHAYDDHHDELDDDRHHDEHDDDVDDDDTHDIDLRVGFGIGIEIEEDDQNDVDVGENDVEDDDDDGENDVEDDDDDGENDVDDDDDVEDDDDDDDAMSFCDVGLSWGHGDGDDDGWYLVGGEME